VAVRHKVQIYSRLSAVIAGSNPVEDMDVGLLCVAEVAASTTTWGGGPVSFSDWCDKWQLDWWGSDKWQVALNAVSRNILLDLSPVTVPTASVTIRVMEGKER